MGTLSIKLRTPMKLQGIHGHGTGLRQSLVWAWWKTQALFALIDSKTPEDHDLDTINLSPVPPSQLQRPTLSPIALFSQKSQKTRFLAFRDCGGGSLQKQPHLREKWPSCLRILIESINMLSLCGHQYPLTHLPSHPLKEKSPFGRKWG